MGRRIREEAKVKDQGHIRWLVVSPREIQNQEVASAECPAETVFQTCAWVNRHEGRQAKLRRGETDSGVDSRADFVPIPIDGSAEPTKRPGNQK